MESISPKELIPYLKTAMELESSVYSQTAAITEAKDKLESNQPIKKTPPKPNKKMPEAPQSKKDYEFSGYDFFFILFGAVCWGLGITLIIISEGEFFLSYILTALGVFVNYLVIRSAIQGKAQNKQNQIDYLAAKKKYAEDLIKCQAEYDREMQQYSIDCKKADDDYLHELTLYQAAEKAIAQLEKPLDDTVVALEKLYQIGWIFPKYHNFVAVCSFYEYFLTGRCAELAGPDGAYNLYESELRQNIIINSLETIVNELESIKSNQYILYKELEKTKEYASQICDDVMGIYSETIKTSNAAHIAASCAETSAKNTEALKYIALINSAK